MRILSFTAATAALAASNVVAFPQMMDMLAAPLRDEALRKRQLSSPQGAGALPLVPPPFNAAAQHVSNQGKHAFVAPGVGDARGECPGLNAMANHGYLPHNGVATIAQFIDATYKVFGMSADLATFLAVYGAIVDGSGTGWSIGGLPHTGILGSHNNYESDSSPLKSDLSQYGTNTRLIMSQFYDLYDMQPDADTANYNLDVLRTFRGKRFYESIQKNPDFAYLPFSGILVSQAAYTFIYRFMSNKSAEYPEGILNKATLKSFMSIQGPEDDLQWVPGNEKIPDNWYKRNDADQYSIQYFETDVLHFAETQPEILSVGCNQGRVNSFDTIDAKTLTNGAYTAEQLTSSPFCFASAFAQAELPRLTGLNALQLLPLTNLLNLVTSGMNCAAIGSVNQSALAVCPGLSFYGGPTGPVAPGAIQS